MERFKFLIVELLNVKKTKQNKQNNANYIFKLISILSPSEIYKKKTLKPHTPTHPHTHTLYI